MDQSEAVRHLLPQGGEQVSEQDWFLAVRAGQDGAHPRAEAVAVLALCRPAFYAELVARSNSKARRLVGIIAHRGER